MKQTARYLNVFVPIGALYRNRRYRRLIYFTAFVLLSGTCFYRFAEGWSWLDSLYFCVISLTTVGYGDLSPKRTISKIFTMFYLLGGISILLSLIDVVAAHRFKTLETLNGDKK